MRQLFLNKNDGAIANWRQKTAMATNNSEKSLKCGSTIPRVVKLFLCLPLVFLLTGAHVDFSDPGNDEDERRRRGGGCVLFIYDLLGGDVSRMEQHGAVEWITEPVIEKGILRASGTITGDHEMFTGEGWVIFNVNEHNKDVRVANILKSKRSHSIGYEGAQDIPAREWQVQRKFFAISVPFDSAALEDLDLVVWGKDIEISEIPLAVRSIKRLTE